MNKLKKIALSLSKVYRVITRKKEIWQCLFPLLLVSIIQTSAFLAPKFRWLPNGIEVDSFLKTLWQVHASIIGVTVIVVTIIITVIANETDRTRTWKLYADKTFFIPVVWFNLFSIISEGLAIIQTGHPVEQWLLSDKVGNLVLAEGLLLVVSVIIAATLFVITFRFLDDDYVENLAEKRIVRAMPEAVDNNLKHIKQVIARLRGDDSGH
jgi:hypothetical protein